MTYDIRSGRMSRFTILGFQFHGRGAAASRLHEKSAFSIHALTGSPTTGLPDYTGERALAGRVLLAMNQAKPVRLLGLHTTLETCGSISRLCVVQQFAKILCVYGFCSIPCFSFGPRNGVSIAFLVGSG